MKSLRKLRGWWRLRFGFCPLCYSSPPHRLCVVCKGDIHYGHEASPAKRERWRETYMDVLNDYRYNRKKIR